MDSEYRTVNDFVSNTGQGLIEEGQDITEIVKKNSPTITFQTLLWEIETLKGH
jgi:hypothetical protein